MDEKHKDILLSERVKLVENINVRGGLYTQLLAKKVLTRRQIQNIKAAKTISEQTEELLDELEQSGSKAFDLFCEALKADHQQEIVDLYLKPAADNNPTEENPKCHNQEVKPTVVGNLVPSSEVHTGVNSPVPCLSDYNIVSDCSGGSPRMVPGSPQMVPGVAVREEIEHQTYRRSIESSHLALQKPNLPTGPNLEHDAYYFYQNTMARPHLAPPTSGHLLYKGNGVGPSEKELSTAGLYRPDIPGVGIDRQLPLTDTNFSKEPVLHMMGHAGHGMNTNMSAYHALSAHPPNVFNSSSPLASLSSSQSPHKGLNPFVFQTADNKNLPSVQKTNEISHSDSPSQKNNNYKLQTNGYSQEPIPTSEYVHQVSSASNPLSSVQTSSVSPTKQYIVERSYIEIPRYIERNNPASSQREMISMPHYRETTPAGLEQMNGQIRVGLEQDSTQGLEQTNGQIRAGSEQTNNQSEQGVLVTEKNVPRLIKNDSVDTMNKRPISDTEERLAKRSKEDPDCIQPEKTSLSTKPIPVHDTDLTVPIICEPVRRPSMPSVVIERDSQQDRYQKGVLQGVMDDPDIDLTDGPIDVKVDHCTRQFYLANFKQAYSMRRIPRGKALILNVNEVTGKPPRRGTDIDRENLHNLLCQLHFDVTVFNDEDGLTAKEMVLKLQDFSQDVGHRNGESAVVCILSHGEEGYIFGSDGKKFELEGAFSLFDNTTCPFLRGKPKIFIVQACRGGALDRGVQYYTDEHDGSDARIRQCPSMSDMLICYPTQNGYYAWRNRDRGSWYVEALVQVFMKYAKCEDICTMLNRVNLLVSKKVSNCPQIEMDQMSQMSEYKSTLRMPHLFFFPGIGTLM